MLVLTRKKDESIMIGHGIELTILDIEGDRIKIGIDAPKDITILRKEVYLDVVQTNKQAISTTIPDKEILKSIISKNKKG